MKTAIRLALLGVVLSGLASCTARQIFLEGNEDGLTKWHYGGEKLGKPRKA